METKSLGNSGLSVSRLALGGLFTSSLGGGVQETVKILRKAAELGITLIDTAPAYADSEEVLGQALRQVDFPFQITTKLGGRPQPFDPQDETSLRRSFDTSLKLLGQDHVAGLLVHEPDRPLQYPWWRGYDPLEGPAMTVMQDMKAEGKTVAIGLAGTTTTELATLAGTGLFDLVLTAFNYNALYREAEAELLPTAADLGMGVIAGSIYGQGFLGRRFDEVVKRKPIWLSKNRQRQFLALYELLDQSGLTLPELCMRFALENDQLSTILVGCKTIEHLQKSVTFYNAGPLPADVRDRLDQIATMVSGRPFEEPMILPFGQSYVGPGMANLGAGIPVGKL